MQIIRSPRSSLYYNRNNNLKNKKSNDHYLTELIKEILKKSKQLWFKKNKNRIS